MKTVCAALSCAALIVLSLPRPALGLDEVDELLWAPAVPAALESTVSFDVAQSAEPPAGDASAQLAHSSDWAERDVLPAKTVLATRTDDESQSGFGVNLVPEPSAVALAALALVYFLVFGRRRLAI